MGMWSSVSLQDHRCEEVYFPVADPLLTSQKVPLVSVRSQSRSKPTSELTFPPPHSSQTCGPRDLRWSGVGCFLLLLALQHQSRGGGSRSTSEYFLLLSLLDTMPELWAARRARDGRTLFSPNYLGYGPLSFLLLWLTVMKFNARWWYTPQPLAAAGVPLPGGHSSLVGSWQDGKTLAIIPNIYLIYQKFCSTLSLHPTPLLFFLLK